MSGSKKRATVYFDPDLHRALRLKAAETERSLSDLVNEAVKLSLAEDAEDLAAFDQGDRGHPTEERSPAHRTKDPTAR
jgi:hypothetical protein